MYNEFTPDLFEEHADDGCDLDIELIGAEQDAILRTLARARDNRRPCPPLRAVDLDAPLFEKGDLLGAAVSEAPPEAFPLTTSLIQKYSEGREGTPRILRVDTEENYRAFRTANSPERTELLSRLSDIEAKLQAHLIDPDAHDRGEVEEDVAAAADLHDAVSDIEAKKRIPLRMPKHFDGLLEAWHEGSMAAASMLLPRVDGGRWVATAAQPLKKGELEAARAATEAGVPAAAIVGYLPAIGATLAAADAVKALASGAESVLLRPEAKGRRSFMVRLEPKASPALYALAEVARMCWAGDPKACDEWNRLTAASPVPVRQAMAEILQAMKAPSPETTLGGAVGDFFGGLWAKIRRFLGAGPKTLPAKAKA